MLALTVVEKGIGAPLVLIPGIQGRWEYVRPTMHALSRAFRVITFPLCGEPSSGLRFERSRAFDNYVRQVVAALDELRVERATICGISFGGLIALAFAAAYPGRTSALILTSTPGPTWRLRKRHTLYARLPWIFGPLFLAEAPRRLRHELATAFPDRQARRRFVRSQLRVLVTSPLSLARMGERALMISTADLVAEAARIAVPTLIVRGERGLDHVIPAEDSLDYLRLITGARSFVLERTGHLGSITRPDAFATVVRDFVATADAESAHSGPALAARSSGPGPRNRE